MWGLSRSHTHSPAGTGSFQSRCQLASICHWSEHRPRLWSCKALSTASIGRALIYTFCVCLFCPSRQSLRTREQGVFATRSRDFSFARPLGKLLTYSWFVSPQIHPFISTLSFGSYPPWFKFDDGSRVYEMFLHMRRLPRPTSLIIIDTRCQGTLYTNNLDIQITCFDYSPSACPRYAVLRPWSPAVSPMATTRLPATLIWLPA